MEVKTKLDKLYSLREEFSIIGITGRTGSGCTDIANIFSKKFDELDNISEPNDIPNSIIERKYEIVYNFNKLNWKSYRVIKYRTVLLLLLTQNVEPFKFRRHLENFYKANDKDIIDNKVIEKVHSELHQVFKNNLDLVQRVKALGDISNIKYRGKLKDFATLYWNEFEDFSKKIDSILLTNGIVERTKLLHHTASNFRKSGQPYKTIIEDYEYIYYIAEVINRIIKGTKINFQKQKKCHIVIDSLRNSLEINFFKERYSGFYLVAVKSDERKDRLINEYKNCDENIVEELLKLDDKEYLCKDFVEGRFFMPDVQNCIQKADYHIITNKIINQKNDFQSVEQQIMKFQGLIQQPGLITPTPIERCMQFAYNAKLSSGCISRQVGAVITDLDYSVKSVGWNDVPRGAAPCSVRNVKDLEKGITFGFSQFELGKGLTEKSKNKDNPDNAEIDKESKDFNKFVINQYNSQTIKDSDLGGINCPYCFKTAYNKFKGEPNQVHTRSLHAEENAMMQISKYGGQPLNGGILFTTASPCELCAKKAYQLGITKIFYIDPYPGISRSHILSQETIAEKDPKLYMFRGAIGKGYLKLYEPFLAQKDEISILTSLKIETPQKVKATQLKSMLSSKIKDNKILKEKLDKLFKNNNENEVFDKVIDLLEKGLKME